MIRVLDRAVRILDVVSNGNGMTLSEISKAVSLPCNTTLRILLSLISYGLLDQNAHNKTYQLGRHLLSLSLKVPYPPSLVEIATEPMQELSERTQEDVGLSILKDGNPFILQKIMGPQPLKIIDSLNTVVPLHCGAFRKLLLAHQPESWIVDYLNAAPYVQFTNTTVLDRKEIELELVRIRKQGFALSHGECFADAAGVAVPIHGLYNEFLAGLFIVGPNIRIGRERMPVLVAELKETAQKNHEQNSWRSNRCIGK